MISEEEAREKVLAKIDVLPPCRVAFRDAVGAFAAEDLAARIPLPVFDNSAMDGYAVIAGKKKYRVVGEQPAGLDRQLKVSLGEAVRIFTGAPIPEGANAVVMQEDVTRQGDEIVFKEKIEAGEFIRRRGCDLSVGQKILSKGERISPTTMALLASQGFSEVNVGGEVSAAVISTGDELAKVGDELQPGQIYETNSALLSALSQRAGATVPFVEHCRDDFDLLRNTIKRGSDQRVLIISGGVSVGAHDFVQRALESLGAKIDIWRVAIKPGKPFLFARLGECVVFGLPGNPVSSFVTFLRFVRPAIWKMMGASELDPPQLRARLAVDLVNEDTRRPHYVRGKYVDGTFTPIGRQESHALFGLSQSNALVQVPAGGKIVRGSEVAAEIWE
jgi:molybdopterin molybdotransferase